MKFFSVVPRGSKIPTNVEEAAFLMVDDWDDLNRFSTQYYLKYVDSRGYLRSIGSVKIGEMRMREGQRRPNVPSTFDRLPASFFSVGQSTEYYEALNELGRDTRTQILRALGDIAYLPKRLEKALHEPVTSISLLRHVSLLTVKGRFRRLAGGSNDLKRYEFSYTFPGRSRTPNLSFSVEPYVEPPTNIHVLIGRNGVGKTYCLTSMARTLTATGTSRTSTGKFTSGDTKDLGKLFANVVLVAFSAFDPFEKLLPSGENNSVVRFSYLGIHNSKTPRQTQGDAFPTVLDSAKEFVGALRVCVKKRSIDRWRRSLKILESDPLFADLDLYHSINPRKGERAFELSASRIFDKLSSGHKIVLLILTRLIADVVEGTLVLIDEPESHLHPPLLSALIRLLSNLLTEQNGVAIIATHSPVVLQEVPRKCVWKLRRIGDTSNAERPNIETFGENVGVLTSEVFGLEVNKSGFHQLIEEAVNDGMSFEQVLHHFHNQLGAEAYALARVLISLRDATTIE
jgi:hypothetical protein